MLNIAETNLFLRAEIALPINFKLAKVELHNGWDFANKTGAKRLEKRIQKRGWNFIEIDRSLRSGVGDTAREATAAALQQGLRQVQAHFNTIEVEEIHLTQYPWFFLAKVWVRAYQIQKETDLPVWDAPAIVTTSWRKKRALTLMAPLPAGRQCRMPQLKAMLVIPQDAERKVG
jgi:hypothetical protein